MTGEHDPAPNLPTSQISSRLPIAVVCIPWDHYVKICDFLQI